MEEGESNEHMQSQPNQESTSTATRDQRTNETKERLPDWPSTPFDEDVHAQLEQLRQDMKKKDEKIDQLQEHILELETKLPLLGKKKRRLSNDELEQQVSDSKDEIIQRMQKEIDKLKEKLGANQLKQITVTKTMKGPIKMLPDAQIQTSSN